MGLTGTIGIQHLIMKLGAVTLVLVETVLGIGFMEFPSGVAVTADLGQNRGRRDGGTEPVTLDNGLVGGGNGALTAAIPVAVDEGKIRRC